MESQSIPALPLEFLLQPTSTVTAKTLNKKLIAKPRQNSCSSPNIKQQFTGLAKNTSIQYFKGATILQIQKHLQEGTKIQSNSLGCTNVRSFIIPHSQNTFTKANQQPLTWLRKQEATRVGFESPKMLIKQSAVLNNHSGSQNRVTRPQRRTSFKRNQMGCNIDPVLGTYTLVLQWLDFGGRLAGSCAFSWRGQ